MPLPFITGVAEGMTRGKQAQTESERRRKQLAYESMLRKEEKAIPTPIAPATGTAKLNAMIRLYSSYLDNYTNEPLPGRENEAKWLHGQIMNTIRPQLGVETAPSSEVLPEPTPKPTPEPTPKKTSLLEKFRQRMGKSEKGITATNPATGERIIYRDGKWQPLQK